MPPAPAGTAGKTAAAKPAAHAAGSKKSGSSTTISASKEGGHSNDEEDSDDDDDDDDDDEYLDVAKPFEELTQAERDKQHESRMNDILTDPIYKIGLTLYHRLALEHGGENISKTGGHYYQFKGKKDADFYVWALVRFGSPVSKEVVENYDRKAGTRALRKQVDDAGLYEVFKGRLLADAQMRAEFFGKKEASPPAPAKKKKWRRNRGGGRK